MEPGAPQIILASASPRRAQLLDQIHIRYRLRPATIDESRRPGEEVETLVRRLALAKARGAAAAEGVQALPVLGADTLVTLGGEILGKPENDEAAAMMLRRLSGQVHRVLTAIAMAHRGETETMLARAAVGFRRLTESEITGYLASGEGKDKAGGYGIQGIGGIFAAHIEGSYSAIVGLPLYETELLLQRFGVATWHNRHRESGT